MSEITPDTLFYKRRLPHFYQSTHPVFLTWRLKFSLPNHVLQHMKEMKAKFVQDTEALSEEYRKLNNFTFHKKVFGYLDAQLDTDKNLPDLLGKDNCAQTIMEALHYRDAGKYALHAFCIMPNHVHVLITPYTNQPDFKKTIAAITQTWKRHTARQINLLMNRTGSLWAEETYDHLVRSETEFNRIIMYILLNPVKAKLAESWEKWRFSWVAAEFRDIMG